MPACDYIETDYGTVKVSDFFGWLKANRCVPEAASEMTRAERLDLSAKMALAAGPKGVPLIDEYVAGTDPNDAASVFSATIEMKDGKPEVGWTPTKEGRRYRIWASDDLVNWREVESSASSGCRFFKVTVDLMQK